MILYKLTDQEGRTRARWNNATQWGEGVTNAATEPGTDLCTASVIHAYVTPELAAFLNPIHAKIENPILWEAEGEICARDGDLKVGCKSLTTLRQIPMPQPTTLQCVAFAILCAKAVYGESSFVRWADDWLSGKDRSEKAAAAAWAAAAQAAAAAGAAEEWGAAAAQAAKAGVVAQAAKAAAAGAATINLPQIARDAMAQTWEIGATT